jgi:hypothetical protein
MDKFLHELGRFRRKWKLALLRGVLCECGGWLALLLACLAWLDYFLAFEPMVRLVAGGASLAALLSWLGFRLAGIYAIDAKASAVYADTLLKSTRREILSALEIGANPKGSSPIAAYLARQGIAAARERLATLETRRRHRLPADVRKRLILALVLSLVPAAFHPGAALRLVGRWVLPLADIAPYSPYVFTITPERPEVIYGADQVISVAIGGAKVDQPVRFATRKAGHILESPCFQAGPRDYVQRLERVMQPLEFCFLVGKARSNWHRVQILYQPHVVSAHFRLTPPAYARQPEKQFALGAETLKGLKGTRVELTIESNRPLKSGELTIRPAEPAAHSQSVAGEASGTNAMTFRWELTAPAQLSMMIHDILGTPAKEPLKILQALIPDEKPVVALVEPLAFSLATPGIKVPVQVSIEDDFGLRRCDLFRSLKGYRGRAVPLAIEPGSAQHEAAYELDLASLGVAPGQVIELFLEASDTNPELTGSGASDVARIKIISEEAYAQMVRTKTTIAAFESRFRVMAEQYDALITALEKTESDLRRQRLTAEQAQARLDALRAQTQKNAEAMKAIAEDFAAFDLEKRLSHSAAKMAGTLARALAHEGWAASDANARLAAVANAAKTLKGLGAENRKLQKDADEVAAVSRIMAMGAWYRSLMDRQSILVSRLGQYAAGDRQAFTPRPLAENEASIREDLKQLLVQLEQDARQLPAGYESLRASSLEFVQKVRAFDIPAPMAACESACLDEQPRQAWRHATQALEKMEEVLRACQGSCFAGICAGGITFKVPDQLSRTMAQMLESLMNQYSQGVGWGSGTGAAGVGIAGAWEGAYLNGYSAFSFPVYGPERKNPFSSEATAADADHGGSGAGHRVGREVSYHENIQEKDKHQTGGAGFSMEEIPPRYREAIKTFYSGEQP